MIQSFAVGKLHITYDADVNPQIQTVKTDLSNTHIPRYEDITDMIKNSDKAISMIERLIDEYEIMCIIKVTADTGFLTFKIKDYEQPE